MTSSDKLDRELSREIATRIGASNGNCWHNAFMGLYELEDGFYVEGWATAHGILLAMHGWIELPDGTIVDPTPCWITAEPRMYFAARKYSRTDAITIALNEEGELPLDEHMRCEMIPPDCIHVYKQGAEYLYGEAACEMMFPNL